MGGDEWIKVGTPGAGDDGGGGGLRDGGWVTLALGLGVELCEFIYRNGSLWLDLGWGLADWINFELNWFGWARGNRRRCRCTRKVEGIWGWGWIWMMMMTMG